MEIWIILLWCNRVEIHFHWRVNNYDGIGFFLACIQVHAPARLEKVRLRIAYFLPKILKEIFAYILV